MNFLGACHVQLHCAPCVRHPKGAAPQLLARRFSGDQQSSQTSTSSRIFNDDEACGGPVMTCPRVISRRRLCHVVFADSKRDLSPNFDWQCLCSPIFLVGNPECSRCRTGRYVRVEWVLSGRRVDFLYSAPSVSTNGRPHNLTRWNVGVRNGESKGVSPDCAEALRRTSCERSPDRPFAPRPRERGDRETFARCTTDVRAFADVAYTFRRDNLIYRQPH